MEAQCIGFEKIPHTTPLFLDFLHRFERLERFYGAPPLDLQAIARAAAKVKLEPPRRAAIADILSRQNRGWGAGAEAEKNIERLRKGAYAVVSGQQVGLFGGPMFTFYKALQVLRLAEELTKLGVDCVPVFWMATEDHDFEEISHVDAPVEPWQLARFSLETNPQPGAPVGGLQMGGEVAKAVEDFAVGATDSDITRLLRSSYRPGATLGDAFARLLAGIFSSRGLVLLDPRDAEVHRLAAPVLLQAARQSSEITNDLIARGKELVSAGYHAQVKVTTSSTLLFSTERGARTVVQRRNGNGSFAIADERISAAELQQRIEKAPESFSPNALLRPVVQDFLLPTVAYVGGAAEIAYFAQSEVIYWRVLGRVTPVVPRYSATLVDPRPAQWLAKYKLAPQNVFEAENALKAHMARAALPPTLHAEFNATRDAVAGHSAELGESLQQLDSTLVGAQRTAFSKIRHQLDRLEARAAQAELRRNSEISRHAAALHVTLFPHNGLQERTIAWMYFLQRYGASFLADVASRVEPLSSQHHFIYL